jgi:hypothetical protein
MKKTYRDVGNAGGWAIAEDSAKPEGNYATREGSAELSVMDHPLSISNARNKESEDAAVRFLRFVEMQRIGMRLRLPCSRRCLGFFRR